MAEYSSSSGCGVGYADVILAYQIGQCIYYDGVYMLLSCSSTTVKIAKCSDAYCSQNCVSENVNIGCIDYEGEYLYWTCNP